MDSVQAEALKGELIGLSIGDWTIVDSYGHGKSAVVMKAKRGDEFSAIKVFHSELVERFGRDTQLARINRELDLVGADHPSLVKILAGGQAASGHLFVQMEAVPWPNLAQVLKDVPESQVFLLLSQVASAARYLEGRGLVHRDIKPENIAVSPDFTKAKLLDLGVIRPFGISGLTDVDFRPFIGTLRYSPPEFLLRQEEDSVDGWRAVNFYQLGAVLHDLLTKTILFDEFSEPYPLLAKVIQENRPKVFGFDTVLVRLAEYCLVKSPKTRIELVSWMDFEPPNVIGEGVSSIVERLKGRQKFFREVGVEGKKENQLSPESARILRQTLSAAIHRASLRVAVLMGSQQVFPLRQTSTAIQVDTKSCELSIQFMRDDSLGLTQGFSATLSLSLIDDAVPGGVFAFSASAMMESGYQLASGAKLGTGTLDHLLGEQLDSFMFGILDAAYDYLSSSMDGGV